MVYNLSKREMYDKVIQDVIDGKTGEIHPDVYRAYSENLRKAVGGVLSSGQYGDKYFDLQAQLQANVSRFAAYKAYHLTQQLNDKRNEWSNDDDFRKVAKAMLNTFNRYQAAEYNTATARARTAKQWTDFNADPISNELYPNLKWLPSRSATPREEHIPFYGLVLPKTDPFWQHNQPGNLWNCKCDWEETDEPAATGRPHTICAKGLEGNPAETGEVFTKECTYFKQAGKNVPTLIIRTERELFRENHKNDTLNLNTSIGNILVDKITIQEISKGAKTDKSYFYKQEIALHFDKYTPMLEFQYDEAIDLTHNNHNNIFYRRKSQFTKMKVYKLQIHNYTFQIKLGEYNDSKLNLYVITEP